MQDLEYLNPILENEQLIPLEVRRQLQSPSPWKRSEGVEHINYLPWSVTGPILEAMAENDPHWDVRLHVANSLQHYDPELSNPLLEKMARTDRDAGVCDLARETIHAKDRFGMNGRDGVAKLKEDFRRYPDPVKEKIMKDVLALVNKLNENGAPNANPLNGNGGLKAKGNGALNGLVAGLNGNGNGKAKADISGPLQGIKVKA